MSENFAGLPYDKQNLTPGVNTSVISTTRAVRAEITVGKTPPHRLYITMLDSPADDDQAITAEALHRASDALDNDPNAPVLMAPPFKGYGF